MKGKKILAIETSAELCSISLSYDISRFDERNILMKHIHSEKLIPMIDTVLKSNNMLAADLDSVAVSMGPGSFTGLRIGLTAAKGIAFASSIPIIPVPTFDALSLEISTYLTENVKFSIANNANVEECYFGKYFIKSGNIIKNGEVQLIKKVDLGDEIKEDDILFGNLAGINNIKLINSPRASSISKWAYLFGEDLLTFDYDYLEPNYLKNFKVRKNK